MKLSIEIESENEAFADYPEDEINRIVHLITRAIHAGHNSGYCRDYNGNRVGEWSFDI